MAYTVADIITDIANTSSTIGKKNLLVKYRNVTQLTDILRFIYDPYTKTGISEKKFNAAVSRENVAISGNVEFKLSFLMDYLMANNTGSNADCDVVAAFYRYYLKANPGAAFLVKAIATQSLKIGVSTTTLNTVYGRDFIPTVRPMLGKDIDTVNCERIKWPVIVTEKLDGVRRLVFVENGTVKVFSRSGHVDDGLIEIEEELMLLPQGYVYDGELIAAGKYEDNIALRQATTSIANSKGVRTGLIFMIFDMVPIDEFRNGISAYGALVRKELLHDTLEQVGSQHLLTRIKEVPILDVTDDISVALTYAELMWAEKREGVMLNTTAGKYHAGKRSKELLKIKQTMTVTLQVVDIEEGKGKYKGTTGSLVTEYKGNKLCVGSGLSDAQRELAWMHKPIVIGSWIEVETFGESKSGGKLSLNCPIFKRYVDDED